MVIRYTESDWNLFKLAIEYETPNPSTGGDPDYSFREIILPFQGNDGDVITTDFSNNAHNITFFGDAQIDNAYSKWGGTSLRLDGAGDYIRAPSDPAWTLNATGKFIIEGWFRPDGTQTNPAALATNISDWNTFANRWAIKCDGSSLIWVTDAGGAGITGTLTLNQWNYFCIARNVSNIIEMGIDGVSQGTIGSAMNYSIQDELTIGGTVNANSILGNLEDFRFSVGIDKDVTDVPTAPFPTS